MDTRKQGRLYVTCPKCGQPVRSEERLASFGSLFGYGSLENQGG